MARKPMQVWHPNHPEMTIWVDRGWWDRTFYPKEFATAAELDRWRANGRKVVDRNCSINETRSVESPTLSRTSDDHSSSSKDKLILPG